MNIEASTQPGTAVLAGPVKRAASNAPVEGKVVASAKTPVKPTSKAVVKAPRKTVAKRGGKPATKKAVATKKSQPIANMAKVRAPANKVVKKQMTKPADKSVGVATSTPVADKILAPKHEKSRSVKAKATHHRAPIIKMVRDSFTFPETEHKRLVEIKKRLIALGTEVKKGELVRAGLVILAAMDNASLLKAVAGVEKLKTGRPQK